MGNRNRNRNQGNQTAPASSEKLMNEQVKQPQDGAASVDDSANASAVVNNGTADQSQQASDSVEPGTSTTQPEAGTQSESTDAGTAQSDTTAAAGDVKEETSKIPPPPPVQNVVTPPPEQPVQQTIATPPPEQPAVMLKQAPAPVKPTLVTPPPSSPVVQNTQPPAQPSTALSGPTKYEEVNRALAGVPTNKLGVIHFLTEYSVAMAPRRPITDKEGSLMQKHLFDAIIGLINKEDEHFTQLWSAVLRYVEKEINGVFSHTHAFRFMDNVPLNPEQCQALASLLHLLRLTAAPASRKDNLKQVSLDKTLQVGVTDSGRQRVLAFYAD
jgi:hypothetical protein